MKTFRTLIQSGLSMMLLLGTATLFTGQAHAQFSSPIHDVDNAARQPVHFGAEVRFVDGSREGIVKVSRAGEFHPHALPELDVNLSAHPAPIHERDPLAPIPQ